MGDAIADEEMGIWDWMLGWRLPDSCGLQRVSVFIINANKNKEEELCSDELTMGAEERRRRLVGRRGLGRVKVHLGPYLVLVIFDNHNLGI